MVVYELRDHDSDDCHNEYCWWLGFQDGVAHVPCAAYTNGKVVIVLMDDYAFWQTMMAREYGTLRRSWRTSIFLLA